MSCSFGDSHCDIVEVVDMIAYRLGCDKERWQFFAAALFCIFGSLMENRIR